MSRSRLLLPLFLVLNVSCASITVQDYADKTPGLALEEFFSGTLTAHGVVKNWRGQVIRTFNADIDAYWNNGVGTLEEDFLFDDGTVERRVWTLVPTAINRYRGTAGDVVGSGEVNVAGNAAFLDYVLRIPFNDGTLDVRIDDRMYLVNDTVLINESSLKKFGIKVGEILLVIEKRASYCSNSVRTRKASSAFSTGTNTWS